MDRFSAMELWVCLRRAVLIGSLYKGTGYEAMIIFETRYMRFTMASALMHNLSVDLEQRRVDRWLG